MEGFVGVHMEGLEVEKLLTEEVAGIGSSGEM